MKKLTYLLASAAILAACQSQPSGYKITGTIDEGASIKDSTLAILFKQEGRNMVYMDTVEVQNKQFVFEGKADSTEILNIGFFNKGEERPYNGVTFVLENGNINIKCTAEGDLISGTTHNDLLGDFMHKNDSISAPAKAAYMALQDTTLSEEDRNAKMAEFMELRRKIGEETSNLYKSFIQTNITNILGYTFFTQAYSEFTTEEQEALISQLPANYANTEAIQNIKSMIEAEKKTAVGQKFIDFSMKTPDGKDLKLSDIVAKNKVTLVDFWASWCGPCRAEMPNVVNDYKNFKSKGFGIVGVSLDNDAEAWKKAIKELGITWEQMSDLKGWQCEGAKLYNVHAIPATVLIGQDGTILAKNLRGEDLTNKLSELLK